MRVNPLLRTDSYKLSHGPMYNKNLSYMFDYIEARKGGRWDYSVFYGLQFFIKDCLLVPFTKEDIDEAEAFYNMHFPACYNDQLFDREVAEYVLEEYGGIWPVRIRAVPEGMVVPTGNILCSFECDDPKACSCVSFLEAMALSYIWYGTTVCTNSFSVKRLIKKFALNTSDDLEWLPFALHDFGARGVIPGGQGIGGAAHLVNSMGSDTLEGIYAAQKYYGVKEGLPGYSVPASEHSVMCSEGPNGEFQVVQRIFEKFVKPGGIVSIVNDTYDMEAHVTWICENLRDVIIMTGVRWVTRPDSGNPKDSVLTCLEILAKYFGTTTNSKGYKVLHPTVRVIQGDGMDFNRVNEVLEHITNAGYSSENVIFGSGGGLLQKVNRDDLRFAMKASYIEVDGKGIEVFKDPVTQEGNYNKKSKKGKISLYRDPGGRLITLPVDQVEKAEPWPYTEMLELVYDKGELVRDHTLDEVRANTNLW